MYFAGSRENEVDQVDKDYKNYKVHKVNWAEVNKMHLCWVFHIKILPEPRGTTTQAFNP